MRFPSSTRLRILPRDVGNQMKWRHRFGCLLRRAASTSCLPQGCSARWIAQFGVVFIFCDQQSRRIVSCSMRMLSDVGDDSLSRPRKRNSGSNHCHPGESPVDVVVTADRLLLLCTGFILYGGQGLVSGRLLHERASFSLSSHARNSEVGGFVQRSMKQ